MLGERDYRERHCNEWSRMTSTVLKRGWPTHGISCRETKLDIPGSRMCMRNGKQADELALSEGWHEQEQGRSGSGRRSLSSGFFRPHLSDGFYYMFVGIHLRAYEFPLAQSRTIWKGAGARAGRGVILETTLVVFEGKDGGLDKASAASPLFSLHFAPSWFYSVLLSGTCLNSYL